MYIIVSYQSRDMHEDSEREFAELSEALRFADATIEDGGIADVTIYIDHDEDAPTIHPCVLATVYVYRDSMRITYSKSQRGKYELIDDIQTCRYCGAEGGCGC